MKTLLALLFALLAQAPVPPVPTAPPSNPADNGSVEGTLIWASQSRPLEGIPVYLRKVTNEPAAEAQRRGISVSDSAGHFLLKDIPPGDYILITDRRGYFRESDAELRITVPPRGTVKNINIRMIVGGSVSGRILDMNGLGLANVRVSTAQPIYLSNGKRDFGRSTAGAQTDDRGDYRVRGLRPGIYYLRADVDFWASDSATYYPGVKDQSGAVSITVRENQESTANFRVEPRLKTVLTVSGQVVSAVPGVPQGTISKILIATRDGGSTYYDNRADDMSNGRFEIRNIFPDVYDLFPDARDKDGVLYTSRTTVELVDRNIENLTLTAAPLVQTQGKVTLNGSPPAGRLEGVTLSLEVVRGLQPFLTATEDFRGPAPITPHAESGEFLTDRLAPGVYKVNAAKLPPDVYLEDLRQGPLSVYTNGFEITDRAGEPVEVLLAGPGGKLDGVVRNIRQEPASRVTVVLVPDPTRRQDRRRYLTVPTDNDGKFTLRAIPPGTYKAFVWEAVPGSAWLNAEFMQKYESRGETVAISKGSAVTVQLTLIPREPEQ